MYLVNTIVFGLFAIARMGGGRLVEQGTRAEVPRAEGVYAALHRRQLLAEQVEGDDVLAAAQGAV